MLKGLLLAVTYEGLACWFFGMPDAEEVDESKRAEGADEVEQVEGTPRRDLVTLVGILLVGILWVGRAQLMALRHKHGWHILNCL